MTHTESTSVRLGFTWRIRQGMAEEYDRQHAVVWVALETRLREFGVESFDIFRTGETVFALVVVRDVETLFSAYAIDPIAIAWEMHMKDLLVDESDPTTGWPLMLRHVWSLGASGA